LAKYRRYRTCPSCGGARIGPSGRKARALGYSYDDLFNGELTALLEWTDKAGAEVKARRLAPLLEIQRELRDKLSCLCDLGLGTSSMSRRSKSLSGGEYQRVLLSRVLGNGLTDALYVLDEPSVGLGPHEIPALIAALQRLRDQGNTVVVVDHDPLLVRSADGWVEFGPGGGSQGGAVVGQGVFPGPNEPESLKSDNTQLRRPKREPVDPRGRVLPKDSAIWLRGFSHLNCDNVDIEIPLRALTVITGPSGAGKSTVLRAGLEGALSLYQSDGATSSNDSDVDEGRGRWLDFYVPKSLREFVLVAVAQKAMHRSIASVPATILGVMDDLRKRFAATNDARERGLGPSDFTFNGAGACNSCEGRGVLRDDLFFLGEVEKTCEDCQGQRYRSDVLEVAYKGHSIAQVLAQSMADCLRDGLFGIPGVGATSGSLFALQLAVQLGLGHLPLGIPSS
jgi:excinuclease ABC subunit A